MNKLIAECHEICKTNYIIWYTIGVRNDSESDRWKNGNEYETNKFRCNSRERK